MNCLVVHIVHFKLLAGLNLSQSSNNCMHPRYVRGYIATYTQVCSEQNEFVFYTKYVFIGTIAKLKKIKLHGRCS